MANWDSLNKRAGGNTPEKTSRGGWDSLNKRAVLETARLKEKEQEEAIRKSQSNLEQSLADYQKEAGGIKGFMNRFLGRGTS